MKHMLLFLCISFFCQGQTDEIVFTTISDPVQKDLYPEGYWNVWVKDLPSTEDIIKNPDIDRRVRQMEYFHRFLAYAKMQTNKSEELLSVFMDAYAYDPHYIAYRYINVFPLQGEEYSYMWDMYDKEKAIIDSMCNELRSSYDKTLVDRIKLMEEEDQYYRKQIGERTFEGLKADGSWEKQLDLDKKNSSEIKAILDEIGYPGRSAVGYENESAVFLVIQHSNLELMEYGLPFVEKAIKNLDLDMTCYAFLYDRIQLVKKLPQLYGTQYNMDGTLYELSDPETVNERRKKHGLYKIKI